MSPLPTAFFIYKEELQKAQEEKKRLKVAYEAKLSSLKEEIAFLKEQIEAQNGMIRNSVEYALKLEQSVESMKKDLNSTPELEKK